MVLHVNYKLKLTLYKVTLKTHVFFSSLLELASDGEAQGVAKTRRTANTTPINQILKIRNFSIYEKINLKQSKLISNILTVTTDR